MTWTKLGDEFGDEARDLSDAAWRTHVEALMWSNRRLLDLAIPQRDVKRFAETDNPAAAAAELVDTGWWQDCGDTWYIGCRFSGWQMDRDVIEARREKSALTSRRHRRHSIGDHTLCQPESCKDAKVTARAEARAARDASRKPSRERSPGSGRVGSGPQPTDQKTALEGNRTHSFTASSKAVLSSGPVAAGPMTCDECQGTPARAIEHHTLCEACASPDAWRSAA